MRFLLPAILIAIALALPVRAEETAGPNITVNWDSLRDLEVLVARVETEAFAQEKKKREPITRRSWNVEISLLPPAELRYPVERPERDSELAFLRAYAEAYAALVAAAVTRAPELAVERGLLPAASQDFRAFAARFTARYTLDQTLLAGTETAETAGKKRAAGEILRFLNRLPDWEKEVRPLVDGGDDARVAEWTRRDAEAKKLIKRFDIGKDVGTGELLGTSTFEVRLGPVGLEFARNTANNLRTRAVVDALGRPWQVNGQPLLVCSEKSLPDINEFVRDLRQEYVTFRYRQLGFGEFLTRDVIKLIGVRLFLARRYFLFYRDQVVLFLHDRPGR